MIRINDTEPDIDICPPTLRSTQRSKLSQLMESRCIHAATCKRKDFPDGCPDTCRAYRTDRETRRGE